MKPRYPVYVISKGRSDIALTPRFLSRDDIPFRLVVEPQEFDLYVKNYGEGNVVALPFSNLGQGSTPARNWCWEDAKAAGHERHWILDDNIGGIRRLYQGKRIPCSSGPALRSLEDFVDRYENVAIGGFEYQMFVTPDDPPYRKNVHLYSTLLIRNDLPYRWRLRYNEDTDLCLQVLNDGLATIQWHIFMIDKKTTMTMKGGNTNDLYGGDGRLRMARTLEATWPGIVSVDWRYGRAAHVIDWTQFKIPLQRRADIDFDSLPQVDEYGLTLRAVREIRSKGVQRVLETYQQRRAMSEYGTTLEAPTLEELEPYEPDSTPEPVEVPDTPVAQPETVCKVEGCSNPSVTVRGPYGRLCEVHTVEAKAARKAKKGKTLKAVEPKAPKPKRGVTLVSLCEDWIGAKADLDHAAAEIRERTGSEPEQFIKELKGLRSLL